MSESLDLDAFRARVGATTHRWYREDVPALLAEVERLRAQVAAPDEREGDPVWALLREAESLPYTKQAIEPSALRAALAERPVVPDNLDDRDSLAAAIRDALKARTIPPGPFGQGGIGLSEYDIAEVALAWFATRPAPTVDAEMVIDAAHLARQREWSRATFGPGARLAGLLDHIRKELKEIEDDPTDLGEWVDVMILALDGAWRAGWEPQQIVDAIKAKQARNEARTWPDWRTAAPDKAIEHVTEAAP